MGFFKSLGKALKKVDPVRKVAKDLHLPGMNKKKVAPLAGAEPKKGFAGTGIGSRVIRDDDEEPQQKKKAGNRYGSV